jgi:N4-gp56 family major capsid protein
MLLSDSSGSKTKALEYFSRKFMDGLAESAREYRQLLNRQGKTKMGYNNGDVFTVSIVSDLPKVGKLAENATTPISDMTFKKVSVTVTEYGGKIKYTNKLKSLSELPIEEIFKSKLARQAAESLDQEAHDMVFATTNLTATATSGTSLTWKTDGTVGTAASPLTIKHVLSITTKMKSLRIPMKENKIYCIASPEVLESIKDELKDVQQHTETGFLRICRGVIGEVYGVVFIEETNVNSEYAYFCGDQAGLEVIVQGEKIIIGNDFDLGRELEVGWNYMGAFMPIENNRVVKVAVA